MYVRQVIILYILNLYCDVYQLYFNKTEGKKTKTEKECSYWGRAVDRLKQFQGSGPGVGPLFLSSLY